MVILLGMVYGIVIFCLLFYIQRLKVRHKCEIDRMLVDLQHTHYLVYVLVLSHIEHLLYGCDHDMSYITKDVSLHTVASASGNGRRLRHYYLIEIYSPVKSLENLKREIQIALFHEEGLVSLTIDGESKLNEIRLDDGPRREQFFALIKDRIETMGFVSTKTSL